MNNIYIDINHHYPPLTTNKPVVAPRVLWGSPKTTPHRRYVRGGAKVHLGGLRPRLLVKHAGHKNDMVFRED